MAPEAAVPGDDFVQQIKDVIMQLQGVIAVQVVVDREGEIAEVHVLADSRRTSKQIVRDIESALYTRLGIRVDHRKISVAQIERGPTVQVEAVAQPLRLRVKETNITFRGPTGEASVCLTRDSVESRGTAVGPATQRSALRLVARATLEAMKEFLAEDYCLDVEDVLATCIAQRDTVLVLVTLVIGSREVALLGSSIIHTHPHQAVVSATLDAMNRFLGSLKIAGKKEEAPKA